MSIKVSVIITNYNNEKYIARAIRSCLKQSLPKSEYEIIVVDDASTDGSREVVLDFVNTYDNVRQYYCLTNQGVAGASNAGIKQALGEYIIRVDSDDYINENTLLFLSQVLEWNKDIGFVYTDHLRVDEEERVLDRVVINTLDLLLRHGAGIMFRKQYLEAVGLYKDELRNAEDYDLIKRYISNFNGYHLKLPLYRYRQHAASITHTTDRKEWEQKADENRN